MNSKELARRSRISALKMVSEAKAAHIASALSMIDILAVIYSGTFNISRKNFDHPERDLVVVSKGHASSGVYAVLGNAEFFELELLNTYCHNGSLLSGHVTKNGVPGVEFSTGSLGHGLPYAVGRCLASKRSGVDRQAIVVVSDGECNEGTIWESALLAAHNKLDNLTVVVDRNRLQSLRSTEDTLALEPFPDKWHSFGWATYTVDGHDHEELARVMKISNKNKPKVIIAETTKGKGVSFMENQVVWHYRPPSTEDLKLAIAELEIS